MRSATRSSPASPFGRFSPNISPVITITRATFRQDVDVTERIASSICELFKEFIIYAALMEFQTEALPKILTPAAIVSRLSADIASPHFALDAWVVVVESGDGNLLFPE
jgi:hypothetical protein